MPPPPLPVPPCLGCCPCPVHEYACRVATHVSYPALALLRSPDLRCPDLSARASRPPQSSVQPAGYPKSRNQASFASCPGESATVPEATWRGAGWVPKGPSSRFLWLCAGRANLRSMGLPRARACIAGSPHMYYLDPSRCHLRPLPISAISDLLCHIAALPHAHTHTHPHTHTHTRTSTPTHPHTHTPLTHTKIVESQTATHHKPRLPLNLPTAPSLNNRLACRRSGFHRASHTALPCNSLTTCK